MSKLTFEILDRLEALRVAAGIKKATVEGHPDWVNHIVPLLEHEAELIALARQALTVPGERRVFEGVAKCHVDKSAPGTHSIWWTLHHREALDRHHLSSDIEWLGGLEGKHVRLVVTVADEKEPR